MGFLLDLMLEASLTHETDMYQNVNSNLCIINGISFPAKLVLFLCIFMSFQLHGY